MRRVFFQFTGELNDLLPRDRREKPFACEFQGSQTMKHLIESSGVPHTEVLRITANQTDVDFSYIPQDGELIEVFPVTSASQQAWSASLQKRLPVEMRFILDNHLGRLAAYLRMLGFDSLYRNSYEDEELAGIAGREERILLTRDRRLLMRKAITYGYCVRNDDPAGQLREITGRFSLREALHPFRRCLRCNGLLTATSKEAVLERLEPLTKLYFDEFSICEDCGQVYWKGSHYERMRQLLDEITNKDL